MHKKNKFRTWFVRYIIRTYKNKLASLMMIALGVCGLLVFPDDGTFFAFILLFAIPLFLSGRNWVYV